MAHVKKYKDDHQCSLKEAMKEASKTYLKIPKLMKGGKIDSSVFQSVLSASYKKDHPKEIDGYFADDSLSTDSAKIYHNKDKNHTILVHRGTEGTLKDWKNNLVYAVAGRDGYAKTDRFKQAKKTQELAEQKYGNSNLSTIGHSQGALAAQMLGKNSREIITYNKASTPWDFTKKEANQHDVRTSGDVVSFWDRKNADITIQSKANPLEQHKTNEITQLGNVEIGQGIRKMRVKRAYLKKK